MAAAKRERVGITQLLSSAACEWLLILLLFAHASLSRLLSSFAKYCQLDPPCILCSSALGGGGENGPGRYWTLLCAGHRREVSTLVSCSVHHRFADVHSMCDECLSPIVNHNKSTTSDSYRLLVGKSLLDVDRSVLQNLVLNKHVRLGPPDHRTCSCCGKTWRAKSGAERLIEFSSNKSNVKPPLSPARPGPAQLSRRDSLKRLRDKFTEHVGYTKLRISSDGESEFPCFSEDGDDDNKGGIGIASNNSCPDLIDLGGGGGSRMNGKKKSLSVNVVFDWKECCEKTSPCLPSPCLTPGVLSLRDDSRLFDVGALSVLSEFLSMCNVPNSPNAGAIPMMRIVEKEGGTPKAKNIKPIVESSSDANPEPGPPSKETSSIADEPKTVAAENLHECTKRECENDKILLANLYRDLEEERNASAIAANQAMAMITRLQEEKAALHMEALQYLRMMEEQAEYDTEALGRANEMLAEKEKEVQDLEIELEFYRNNFLDESAVHNLQSETKSGDSVEEDKAQNILRCLEMLEKSLRNEEGDLVRENRIELVREVAHQLQELKKVELERRSLFVHHED